ncbi:unnamed protein product [Protopolystoma xenopodis]|uniref:Uncharacterized protein n=1 Tax=Protopolystoma xenopodis TaxID=117903 RepID=A0A448XEK6_9PLAT|nr:unnamed protein product [Protopolystoma xenopodis]
MCYDAYIRLLTCLDILLEASNLDPKEASDSLLLLRRQPVLTTSSPSIAYAAESSFASQAHSGEQNLIDDEEQRVHLARHTLRDVLCDVIIKSEDVIAHFEEHQPGLCTLNVDQ